MASCPAAACWSWAEGMATVGTSSALCLPQSNLRTSPAFRGSTSAAISSRDAQCAGRNHLQEGLRGTDETGRGIFRDCHVAHSQRMTWAHARPRLPSTLCQAGSLGSVPPEAASPLGRVLLPPAFRQWAPSKTSTSGREGPVPLRRAGKVGQVVHRGNYAVASFAPVAKEPLEAKQERKNIGQTLTAMMPYIVVAAAITALTHPPSFTWFQKQHYPTALGGIMLSIGVQLSLADFETVFKQPQGVGLGLVLQYCVKPAVCLLTVALFRVPPQFAAGLILTACVSGAQLASYAASLAKGSVALSVVLTSLSTLASVVVTPALSKWLIGAVIPVDAVAMAKSILQVVILPVALGLLLNAKARPLVDRARPYLPLMAILCTVLCIGSPLAFNQKILVSGPGLALIVPVLFFHVASAAVGYWMTQIPGLRQDEATSRTVALNGAMQSSTLAMLLASQFLGASHAVPPSCSVVIMSVIGLSLGSFWGKGQRLSDVVAKVFRDLKEELLEGSSREVLSQGRKHGAYPCAA